MDRVVVVMSTYNGDRFLERQISSIFAQHNVDVYCYVRDDGSTDATCKILNRLKLKFKEKLMLDFGENLGWRRSFLEALSHAPEADYYAFSDQDDVWDVHKLEKCISLARECDSGLPVLVHCNKTKVDVNLNSLSRQQEKTPTPPSLEWAMLNGYVQGCSALFNRECKTLACRHFPDKSIAFDYWIGLIPFLFGKVLFCDEPLLKHVMHDRNVSTAQNLFLNQARKARRLFQENHFPNVSADLLEYYSDLLSDDQRMFLEKMASARHSRSAAIFLLKNKKFRPSASVERPFFIFLLATCKY